MRKIIIILMLLISFNALAVTVQWENPTTREDNSPLLETDISGYRLYYGIAAGDYQQQINIAGFRTTALVELPPGAVYFAVMTVIDSEGRESMYSPEISFDYYIANPKSVINIQLTR